MEGVFADNTLRAQKWKQVDCTDSFLSQSNFTSFQSLTVLKRQNMLKNDTSYSMIKFENNYYCKECSLVLIL